MKNTGIRKLAFRHRGAEYWVRGLACLAVFLLFTGTVGVTQSAIPPQPNGGLPGPGRNSQGFPALPENANPHPTGVDVLRDSTKQTDNEKKLAEINALRQKLLADDTAKLLALANELKAEMDKTSKDTLSMNVVRKAEQIEKLAHQVRDAMRASLTN